MSEYVIYQGDTAPPLVMSVVDEDGNPVDLTGSTCYVSFGPVPPATFPTAFQGAGSTSVSSNVCTYVWASSDTQAAATYLVQLEIVWAGGQVQRCKPFLLPIAAPVYAA